MNRFFLILRISAIFFPFILNLSLNAGNYSATNETSLNLFIEAANSTDTTNTISFLNDINNSSFTLRPLNSADNFDFVDKTLTIEGNNHSLITVGFPSGPYTRGFFVGGNSAAATKQVTIQNLSIQGAKAIGGDSQAGGAGAGLGGALFVGEGTDVVIKNVTFDGCAAVGGKTTINSFASGGGGLGGNAGLVSNNLGHSGGGGFIFDGGDGSGAIASESTGGGGGGPGGPGGDGDVILSGGGGNGGANLGAVVGATGTTGDGATSTNGGGGAGQGKNGLNSGGNGDYGGGGGGSNGSAGTDGGNGGFGGGGGGGKANGGDGGFGGGGGFGVNSGGNGGFGAGGGGSETTAGTSSFGGGAGLVSADNNKGGSGAAMGGAIFIQNNGTLTVQDYVSFNNSILLQGGTGSQAGQALGKDIFMMSEGEIIFDLSQDVVLANAIEGNQGQGQTAPDLTLGGLTKQGAASLAILDTSTVNSYTGSTTVNNGALIINGTIITPVTVNAGVLKGNLTIKQDALGPTVSLTNVAGIVAPGRSIGTIQVQGNFTQQANGTLQIEVSQNTSASTDLLNVTGDISLDGTLNAIAESQTNFFTTGTEFIFLTYSGNRVGSFASEVYGSNLNFNVVYDDANKLIKLVFQLYSFITSK